jgi:hypothetical protein
VTQILNFITAGCSFTAGTSCIDQAKKNPVTWAHYLLSTVMPKFFYNLAIPGGGNQQLVDNLIYLLETKKYIDPQNTLIGINITGLDRIDTMCAIDHPNSNKNFSWANEFNYSWITEGSFINKSLPFNGALQKNVGLTQIQLTNCLSIVKCFSYLEKHGFNYFFMIMNDNIISDSPAWFNSYLLEQKTNSYIKFNDCYSMHSFAKSQNLLEKDNFHPDKNGNQLIASKIVKFLFDKKLISECNDILEKF